MKKKKRGRLTLFLLFFLCLLLVWFGAFLVWLFWSDLEGFVKGGGKIPKIPASEQTRKPSQEKISEEDRKKLEEILKRR